MRHKLRAVILGVLGVGLLASLLVGPEYLRGASLVVRAAGMQEGWASALARWRTVPFEVSDLQVPSRHGPLRARVYRPRETRGHPIVLTSGVHADGIDEPRLVKLAKSMNTFGYIR